MMNDEEKTQYKETEFDSSIATLQRIDNLIKILHMSKANIDNSFRTDDYYFRNMFYEMLDEIYSEGQTKFTKDEKVFCKGLQNKISEAMENYGNNLWNHTIKIRNIVTINIKYIEAWKEVMPMIRRYRIYLMIFLDRHNMLMKTSKMGIQKFRYG